MAGSSLTRTFDAPRALIWQTELDHLSRWWGPKGLTWLKGTLEQIEAYLAKLRQERKSCRPDVLHRRFWDWPSRSS
jgi:uncharacterized protein YndB with AHSA1/START domain